MNWTEWNDKVGSKIVDRAFAIAKRDGIEPGSAIQIESLLRQARRELSREAGIDPYENIVIDDAWLKHSTPNDADPLGYLVPWGKGHRVCCIACATTPTITGEMNWQREVRECAKIYAVNLGLYQQHCCECGKQLNPAARSNWPELFHGQLDSIGKLVNQ